MNELLKRYDAWYMEHRQIFKTLNSKILETQNKRAERNSLFSSRSKNSRSCHQSSLARKVYKTNCEKAELEKSAVAKHSWTNDHRIKWNEASILATESHKFSRKMRESIEIEKHSTIDQEGNPLDSTWLALFTMQN